MLTVPGDIPLVTADEIEPSDRGAPAVARVHHRAGARRAGSNAILCSPPDAVPLRFGDDSFFPHLRRPRRAASPDRAAAAGHRARHRQSGGSRRFRASALADPHARIARREWYIADPAIRRPRGMITDELLARAQAERRLSAGDALALRRSSDPRPLMRVAAALRDEGHGGLVSYSRKVFIPLTQLCRDVCHYCTFAHPPRRGEPAYLSAEEVLGDRPRRRRGRLPRGAVHARRQAGTALSARRARRWPGSATRRRSPISANGRAGAARNRAAAASQPRRDEPRRDRRPARGFGVAGHHAGERGRAARRSAADRISARPTSARRCGWRRSRRPARRRCRSPRAS